MNAFLVAHSAAERLTGPAKKPVAGLDEAGEGMMADRDRHEAHILTFAGHMPSMAWSNTTISDVAHVCDLLSHAAKLRRHGWRANKTRVFLINCKLVLIGS